MWKYVIFVFVIVFIFILIQKSSCNKEDFNSLYKLEFSGRIDGYSVDCTKKISDVYLYMDSIESTYKNYGLNFGHYYNCLFEEIEVNDRILKTKDSYKIVLIKKNGKRIEYDFDCNSKCDCSGHDGEIIDYKKYIHIQPLTGYYDFH